MRRVLKKTGKLRRREGRVGSQREKERQRGVTSKESEWVKNQRCFKGLRKLCKRKKRKFLPSPAFVKLCSLPWPLHPCSFLGGSKICFNQQNSLFSTMLHSSYSAEFRVPVRMREGQRVTVVSAN